MKISINKNKITATIVLTLMLTMTAIFSSSIAVAQEPDYREKQTYGLCIIMPNPVGVNQEVLVSIGITDYLNEVADGWEDIMLTVTDPTGAVKTMGPYRTDSTGITGVGFIPDMVGTYKFQSHFPTQFYNWTSPPMFDPEIYGNILYLESDSEVVELVVQEDPIEYYPEFKSYPDEYWTRPINAQIREWMYISGNWLRTPPNMYAPYNDLAPDTAHILWSTPLTYGGLAGGSLGGHGFFCGDAYQGKWSSPVILGGVLYYNTYSSSLFGGAANNGIVAKDIHTGEILWTKAGATVSFGQTFYWSGQNSHSVFAYIWETKSVFDWTTFTSTTTWNAYDPFDGQWMYSIENPPTTGETYGASYTLIGENGEILVYSVNTAAATVSLWDSSTLGVGFESGSWSPDGQTYNGTLGYVWTKPIPEGLPGSVVAVLEDRVLGSTAGGLTSMDDAPIEFWCISLAEGAEGTLLWQNTWNPPSGQLGVGFEAADLESGVYVLKTSETRQYYGFDLDSGANIWGPTAMQGQFDIYALESNIAYGKLFSTGYDGTVYCYDTATGDLDWKVVVEDPYSEILWGNNWPLHQAFITDGKIYVIHSEHSPIDPKPRGAPFLCIDIETGDVLWQISLRGTDWGGHPIIGDSIIAMYNTYDQQVYALGKGPSAMSVSIQDDVVSLGDSVLIKGTITDVSPGTADYGLTARFPNGVPVVADADMSAWMEYVYMQFPRPDADGVDIRLEMIDSDGVATEIGWTKSDASGFFKVLWKPSTQGTYTIRASFMGSLAFYGSFAETAVGVTPAVSPATPIEPETPETPEEPETPVEEPETPETPETPAEEPETPEEPEPEASEAPLITTEIAIVIAVVVACVIGVVSFVALKKRK